MCTNTQKTICRSISDMDSAHTSSSTALKRPMSQAERNALAKLPGNNSCIDCGNLNDAQWASITFGILFCAKCAQTHKSFNTSVQSIARDSWTREEWNCMRLGGNERFRAYLDLRDVDFAVACREERYTCEPAREYQRALKAMAEVAKGQEENKLNEIELEALTESSGSDDSLDDRRVKQQGSSIFMLPFVARTDKIQVRANTDGSWNTAQEVILEPLEEMEVIQSSREECPSAVDRNMIRQPVTSLNGYASKCVRRCLEENRKNQSFLYKLTAGTMTPTVTHMGRKYQANNAGTKPAKLDTTPLSLAQEPAQVSLVQRIGLIWKFETPQDEREILREQYNRRLRDITDEEFSKLKAALKEEGVRTNLCLGLLYSVAATSCFDPETQPSPSKSVDDDEPLLRWGHQVREMNDRYHDEKHTGRKIVVSPCA